MAEHNDFGKESENLAVEFLEKKGYKILVKNYRYLKAEIDIIAETENQIVIIEVKARSTDTFLSPEEAVNKKKIRLLISAASHFLEENEIDKEVRFDIIAILPNEENQFQIKHIENAFEIIDILGF